MIAIRSLSRPVGLILILVVTGTLSSNATESASSSEAYLNALQGKWLMKGTLRDKPVLYIAEGRRVLQDGFVELHMLDRNAKPSYEADVFIGYDPKGDDYIVHWLDRFGAAGARVVGRGKRQDQKLTVIFPYAEGSFRDTFTWRADSKSWALLLESQKADGSWSTFANYTLTVSR